MMFDFLSLVEKHHGRMVLRTILVLAILVMTFSTPCRADDSPKADVPKADVTEPKVPATEPPIKDIPATEPPKVDLPSDIKSLVVGKGNLSLPQSDRVTLHFRVFSKDKEKNLKVVVYYGTEDGGLDPTQWEKHTGSVLPDKVKGSGNLHGYTVTLHDLKPKTNYFYRVFAQNSTGKKWSEPGAFKTTFSKRPWCGSGSNLGKKHVDHSKNYIIMTYDVDKEATARAHDREGGTGEPEEISRKQMEKLILALHRRLNPTGEENISIRQRGADQVEITIPDGKPEYVKCIKNRISEAGTLEFRVLTNPHDEEHKELIDLALAMEKQLSDPPSEIRDENGELLGWWNPVDLKREDEFGYMRDHKNIVTRVAKVNGAVRLEVLVVKDIYNVTGDYFTRCSVETDNYGRPAVYFNFNSQGADLFGELTGNHRPVEGAKPYKYQLGIILNGDLYSAPSINDRITNSGIISGDFTNEKAQDLADILNAGSLPVFLEREPSSQLTVGPMPGEVKSTPDSAESTPDDAEPTPDDNTMSRGEIAILVSVISLFVFIAIAGVFYRSRRIK